MKGGEGSEREERVGRERTERGGKGVGRGREREGLPGTCLHPLI